MKKTRRKRLELERDVVKVLAVIPVAGLKHVPGGGEPGGDDSTEMSYSTCSESSCVFCGCLPFPL
jgi:hypothetical protein